MKEMLQKVLSFLKSFLLFLRIHIHVGVGIRIKKHDDEESQEETGLTSINTEEKGKL